jgi:hypothetical protein
MKKEATLINAKGLIKNNLWWKKRQLNKCKGARQKRPLMKKEAIPVNAKGLIKKTSTENGATPINTKGLIKKKSSEKGGNPNKCKGPHQKDFWGKRGIDKAQKFSSKNKCTPKPASTVWWSKVRVTLFGLNHKQQAAWGRLTKPKIK